MSAEFTIDELDVADDTALARYLAFTKRVGVPRFGDVTEFRASLIGATAHRLLGIRGADGELRATIEGRLFPGLSSRVIQVNGFLEPGARRELGALVNALELWGRSLSIDELFAHVNQPSAAELQLWSDAGFTRVGARTRLLREVREADRAIAECTTEGLTIVALGDRPELEPQADQLWSASHRDIPSAIAFEGERTIRDELELSVEEPMPPSLLVAVTDGDDVVGVASLVVRRRHADVEGGHRFTGVAPAWRGRGVARALKVELIRWAARNQIERLVASNDEHNGAMRAINESLGYVPLYEIVLMRRPVAGVLSCDPGTMKQ